jgi:hypothetical protein
MGIRIASVVLLALAAGAGAESSLTIYNQNFAVVRESLSLDLQRGTNQVSVTQITAHVEPDSVILRDPQGKRALQILEQNYRADPVSQGLLLSLYEGKEIDFLVLRGEGKEEIVRGRIVRSGYEPHRSGMQRYGSQYAQRQVAYAYGEGGQPIIEVNGRLRFSLPGQPLFPALGDDTILKPTIHWLLETDAPGKLDAELSYVTGGMSWEADYSMLARSQDDAIDVIGWVTMDNQSGKTFENAHIKLMAGDVSKIQPGSGMMEADVYYSRAAAAMPAPVSEKAFEEYHLYTLNRPTTLHDRETKQVEFLRAEGVRAQRLYVYDGARIDHNRTRYSPESLRQDRDYGTQSNPKVWVMRELQNTKENHLGMPLPRGRMRFYQRDDDGQLEFIGENTIDHTPRDETVRVYTGDAFDLVGERRRTDYQIDTARNWLDEAFEIKVRNRKESGSVEIRVVEHLYRWINWRIVESSDPFTKTDSQTIEFRVRVPAGQEKVVTYKAHYTW